MAEFGLGRASDGARTLTVAESPVEPSTFDEFDETFERASFDAVTSAMRFSPRARRLDRLAQRGDPLVVEHRPRRIAVRTTTIDFDRGGRHPLAIEPTSIDVPALRIPVTTSNAR